MKEVLLANKNDFQQFIKFSEFCLYSVLLQNVFIVVTITTLQYSSGHISTTRITDYWTD